ncbi:MAG: DUF2189 domain-containing protein, partial [Hyphomicrobium sp.]|nr:DUF2189 domain-containing protein [Hyphomicrobium sp.]
MMTPKIVTYADATIQQPRADVRWPASAIWRPGEPAVRSIGLSDLKEAVAKGIDDFNAMPTHAVFLGIIYAVLGLILFRLAFGYDVLPLVYPILAGFILLGPFAAITLYELSRRREQGLDVSVEHLFEVFRSPSIGAITRLGLVLTAIFVAWLVLARTMYAQIMGGAEPASLGEFARQILTKNSCNNLIIVGNTVGFVFALLVLVISVISFPMLVDRKVSAGTAVRTSVRAVAANPLTMAASGAPTSIATAIAA